MFKTVKDEEGSGIGLKKYLSPVAVWALSFGCAVGWGSFVMPGTTFLPIAGPLGTTVGMIAGALVMLVIGVNYHYMMNRFCDSGGTYTYAKKEFGYDHGFLSAWFLLLVYVAIIWANATAIPLIFRNLFGGLFQFGFHYTVAGFNVYMGEVMLSVAALIVFGLVCIRGGKVSSLIQTVLAFTLIFGVIIVFIAACRGTGGRILSAKPAYIPSKNGVLSVLGIMVLAPWAFAGFESVSNSAEEFSFSLKRSFLIMAIAVITSTLAYVFLALIASSVQPSGFSDWYSYINRLDSLSGIEGLPVFYAVSVFMGRAGLIILLFTMLAGVITGLVGNYTAAGRLIYSMAKDDLLPGWFHALNRFHTPKNAILFVMLLSLPIPFFGRTAIGWIVDVNTIGATIAYAYTSATAYKRATDEKNSLCMFTGAAGCIISVIFFLYFMIPNFWTVSALSTESYLILIAWGILGFLFFRYIFLRDTARRLGKSTVVWIVLLFLILFTSMLWFRQASHSVTKQVLSDLNIYNEQEMESYGLKMSAQDKQESETYLEEEMETVNKALTRNSIVQMILIILALFIMFNIYNSMMYREKELEISTIKAEQRSKAKSVFLSNMSHDIRTPMNAIIGYTKLARKIDNPPETASFLEKIEASGQHLLALINDVLEMSRIESGKMELALEKTDLKKDILEIGDLFSDQMEAKGISFVVDADEIVHNAVLCDRNCINRVLLNLLSNAFKFTPPKGKVSLLIKEVSYSGEGSSYEIRVKDSGMGMSDEFAAKVFESYSREEGAEKIQGTGLGMAITKSLVELMGGTIDVKSQKGVGTEFIIRVSLNTCSEEIKEDAVGGSPDRSALAGKKVLLVDDNDINREIATLVLLDAGLSVETAENGREAFDRIAASEPGEFDAVLMDIQMPVMNGYEASKAIRKLEDPGLSKIPIVAMTANAFAEDIQNAKDAGMDGHIAKPFDSDRMFELLSDILKKREESGA